MKRLDPTPDNILRCLQHFFATPLTASWQQIVGRVEDHIAVRPNGWLAVRRELQVLLDADLIHRTTGTGEAYTVGAKLVETLTLHGEEVTLEQSEVLSLGVNTQCRTCVTKSKLSRSHVDGKLLVENGRCLMYAPEDLSGFYLNTPANRKLLTAQAKAANA